MRNARMMRQAEREAELSDPAQHAFYDSFVASYIEEHAGLRAAVQEA